MPCSHAVSAHASVDTPRWGWVAHGDRLAGVVWQKADELRAELHAASTPEEVQQVAAHWGSLLERPPRRSYLDDFPASFPVRYACQSLQLARFN